MLWTQVNADFSPVVYVNTLSKELFRRHFTGCSMLWTQVNADFSPVVYVNTLSKKLSTYLERRSFHANNFN